MAHQPPHCRPRSGAALTDPAPGRLTAVIQLGGPAGQHGHSGLPRRASGRRLHQAERVRLLPGQRPARRTADHGPPAHAHITMVPGGPHVLMIYAPGLVTSVILKAVHGPT